MKTCVRDSRLCSLNRLFVTVMAWVDTPCLTATELRESLLRS